MKVGVGPEIVKGEFAGMHKRETECLNTLFNKQPACVQKYGAFSLSSHIIHKVQWHQAVLRD